MLIEHILLFLRNHYHIKWHDNGSFHCFQSSVSASVWYTHCVTSDFPFLHYNTAVCACYFPLWHPCLWNRGNISQAKSTCRLNVHYSVNVIVSFTHSQGGSGYIYSAWLLFLWIQSDKPIISLDFAVCFNVFLILKRFYANENWGRTDCFCLKANIWYVLMSDLGRWTVIYSIGVVSWIHLEVDGSQLHDAGLQRVPPSSPGVPNYPIICQSTVVTTGVVHAIKMGRVTPWQSERRRNHIATCVCICSIVCVFSG